CGRPRGTRCASARCRCARAMPCPACRRLLLSSRRQNGAPASAPTAPKPRNFHPRSDVRHVTRSILPTMTARPRSAHEPGDRSSMSAPRYVSAGELEAAISFPAAVDALHQAFAGGRDGVLEQVPRTVTPVSEGDDGVIAEVLLMPAFGPEGTGVKIVTIA